MRDGDLWQRLALSSEARALPTVKLTKVKSHLGQEGVRSGAISAESLFGNAMADRAASDASYLED
eukprot:8771958-Alexandrium_andersonii.AAC.1